MSKCKWYCIAGIIRASCARTECDVSLCKVTCFKLYHKYSDVENAWCKWRVDEDAQDGAGSSGATAE